MLHQAFAAMESGQPYGIGTYFAYRHDPLTAMPDSETIKQALDKLKLLVSIDVRYSETGWFADLILPEATYLERANILTQMNGPIPFFAIRDQAIAPRFDSRPAWWIFAILRLMGIKEALNFETIEELWNYQLEGTGVTVADIREHGFVSLAAAPTLTPHDHSAPDAFGQDRDRERASGAGRPVQPAALDPRRRPRTTASTWSWPPGHVGPRSIPQQPAPRRDRAGAGALDSPRPRTAAGHQRRRRRRSQRGRELRGSDQGTGHALDSPRGGLHASRLWRHGAARHARPWSRAWPTSACSRASSTTSTLPAVAAL